MAAEPPPMDFAQMGQLMKLDPSRPQDPVVWSIDAREIGFEGAGGSWSTLETDFGTAATTSTTIVAWSASSARDARSAASRSVSPPSVPCRP